MTPEFAELRRLHSEWQETVKPYGFRLMPSGEYYSLVAAAVNALPALLNATDELLVCKTVARGHLERAERATAELDALRLRLVAGEPREYELTAERDALAAKVERVRVLADHTEGATHRCNPGNVWECPGCWSDRLRAALDEEADHA